MAIATYAQLQTAVADWLNRTDAAVVARVPDFITLAEARMMRKLRLRLFEQETTLPTVIGSRTLSLPADYREPINLWITLGNGRVGLNYIQAGVLNTTTTNAQPRFWAIDDATIAFDCPADQIYSLTFRYLQKLALSDAAPTNALLTAYPDAYLTASLAEACRYLKDPASAEMWDQKHNQITHDIREQEERANTLTTLHTEPGQMAAGRRSFDINRGW